MTNQENREVEFRMVIEKFKGNIETDMDFHADDIECDDIADSIYGCLSKLKEQSEDAFNAILFGAMSAAGREKAISVLKFIKVGS